MILLFADDATTFETLGLEVLKPVSAVVRKEDNGDYYLDYRDKATNSHLYQQGFIIAVDTPWGRQAFRIQNPKINGSKVDFKAWHIFYDARNYLIDDAYIVSNDANYALNHINSATDQPSPFNTISDVTTVFSLRTVRKSLYQAVLDLTGRWGGHLVLDNYNIELRETVGQDRGVTVAYGKNITGFKKNEIWDDVATKLLPVGRDGIELDETYIEDDPSDYNTPYSLVLSFDQKDIDEENYKNEEGELDEVAFKTALKEDLANQAIQYLSANHFPKVNYSVDAFIEGITDIGDVVRVNHPRLNVPLVTNVLAINYDAIAERIDKVEFGNFNPKLSNLVSDTRTAIEDKVEQAKIEVTTSLEQALISATNGINGMLGNSYVIYEGDQLLVVDSLPKETATNVMRINSAGIGFSNTGINGTFNSAWSIDGTFDAQQANLINLVANQIKGGSLRLGFFDGNNGIIEIYDQFGNNVGQIDQNGIVLANPNGDELEISPVNGLSAYSTASGVREEVFSIDRDVTNIAKLHARDQIEMSPLKVVPIPTGSQAGWAFVKLDT